MPIFSKAASVPSPVQTQTENNAFAEIFTLPEIAERPIANARPLVDRATVAVADANAELDAAAKMPRPRSVLGVAAEPAALITARRNVATAEAKRRAALNAMAEAVREREEQFHIAVMQRFEKAAPFVAATAEMLAEAVLPMAELHSLAWKYRLPIPRLLAEVPRLQDAVRSLTVMGNARITAAPVESNDESA